LVRLAEATLYGFFDHSGIPKFRLVPGNANPNGQIFQGLDLLAF
jgi:hypothetical protein